MEVYVVTPFIPFVPLKERVSILDIAALAGLQPVKVKGGEYRCACPVHSEDKRSLVINTEVKDDDGTLGVFHCQAQKVGGDKIGLLSHVRGVKQYAAAKEINEKFPEVHKPQPVPEEKDEGGGGRRGFSPPSFILYDHEAVRALGFTPEDAKALGVAFWPRGLHRGRVAFCLRTKDGVDAGWISVTEGHVVVPPKWHL